MTQRRAPGKCFKGLHKQKHNQWAQPCPSAALAAAAGSSMGRGGGQASAFVFLGERGGTLAGVQTEGQEQVVRLQQPGASGPLKHTHKNEDTQQTAPPCADIVKKTCQHPKEHHQQ